MRRAIVALGCCMILIGSLRSQEAIVTSTTGDAKQNWPQLRGPMSHDPNFKKLPGPSFYKRKSEWRKIIDSTWGPGLPLEQKLSVFDYYSGYVRAHYPTFGYTHLNWDSVSAYWRAKITDSTSRGGFSAILSYLARELLDTHAWAWDDTMTVTPLNPGTPLLVDVYYDGYGWSAVSHFGAGLTVLPDSSLLVYMVVPNHPLGLEPGDIVLGYEGIPWRKLVQELMDAGIPRVQKTACSQSASSYALLYCAGMNWHLFDTIDVVKYRTGQTVHLPTDTMISLKPMGGLVNGAQLPVPGVPMPAWVMAPDGWTVMSDAVSYGIVEGTNIGYIYVYHHRNSNDVGILFDQAVSALWQTQGLIIDIRFDMGGAWGLNKGIARLTTYAGSTLATLVRSSPSDPVPLQLKQGTDFNIPQDNIGFQHPVAVLIGPTCLSYGDITYKELTYLDNVRFFGKPPHSGFGGMVFADANWSGFTLECPDVVLVDSHSPSTQIWGKEFPPDEQVWLTRDGVAKGEDDVVKRAIEWITTLTYAHDVALDRHYARPGLDSVCITCVLANPLNHTAVLSAVVTDALGAVRDSVVLLNDGLHGDGIAGDSIWGCRIIAPSDEGIFGVGVRTDDITQGTFRRIAYVTGLATAGPVKYVDYHYYKSSTDTIPAPGVELFLNVGIRNMGKSAPITNVTARVSALDTLVDYVYSALLSWGSLFSGDTVYYSSNFADLVLGSDRAPGSTASFAIDIASNGFPLWRDTIRIVLTGVEGKEKLLPTTYALEQNYPNPFNPSTTIKYELPKSSMVRLSVYDILGREVSVLVNQRKDAGVHEVKFDAAGLSSGVYIYRIQAGDFVQAKTFVLLK